MMKLPTKGLLMAHLNVCSLRNKLHEIGCLVQLHNIHILTISETHLDSSFENEDISIHGYNIFRKDRNRFGGGVAVYIQSHIPAVYRADLINNNLEALWVQVHLPHLKPILIGCCYRPPSADIKYLDEMCSMLDKASDEKRELYVLGDMNIDWLDTMCPLKSKLYSMTQACNLIQVMSLPTRIFTNKLGKTSSTCIDHIFTNYPDHCSKAVSLSVGFSDHNLVALSRKTKIPKGGNKVIYKRSYKYFKTETFLQEVEQVQWSKVCNENDPEAALTMFMKLFMKIVNGHAPLTKFTVKANSALWIDKELKDLMTLRDNAKKIANRLCCLSARQEYCKLRNLVTKLNKSKKKEYYKQRISEVKNDGKKLWTTMNEIMGRKSSTSSSFIQSDGVFITKPYEIANYFNNFFIGKVDKLRNNMQSSDGAVSNKLISNGIMENNNCHFEFQQISTDVVMEMLMSLPEHNSSGTDNLDGKLIKLAATYVAAPIAHIFNKCLIHGVHPTLWKEAKIIPLPKDKNSTFNGPNSRPISILPALSKLIEKIIFKQIQDYFSSNKLISNFQHAYREGHSTCTALAEMTDDWITNIDNRKLVGAVMLDFSAAFDVIDHDLLIGKLECYGFTRTAVSWIKDYLTGRKQRVFFNGSLSDVKDIYCGVPQGSCLGPLLFSIFTNDLPLCTKNTNVVMYADDTTLYCAATSANELTVTINNTLIDVYNWVESNKLVLNIVKTKSIVFGSRHLLANKPQLNLVIGTTIIQQVKTIKLLGLTIVSSLSWSDHIDNIVSKMGRGIGMTRKCSSYLTPTILKQVIHSLVLSHLEYCPVIWSSATKKDLQKLQVAQNKAARLALSCSIHTSTKQMHSCLSWLTVVKKVSLSLLMFLRSVISSDIPAGFAERLVSVSNKHGYSTRGASKGHLALPKPRTNLLKHTISYRSISIWNSLPKYIISSVNSKYTFKKHVKKHLAKMAE